MIASNKKLNPIVTELSIRFTKLNIYVFLLHSFTQYFCYTVFFVPKNIRLKSMHYFIMKIPNKREIQQIAFNHSSDIDFKDFMNLYKKCTEKPFSFLVIDATLASDNLSRFRKNLSERIKKLIMKTDDKVRDEKLQYDINREAAKISGLSSGKN